MKPRRRRTSGHAGPEGPPDARVNAWLHDCCTHRASVERGYSTEHGNALSRPVAAAERCPDPADQRSCQQEKAWRCTSTCLWLKWRTGTKRQSGVWISDARGVFGRGRHPLGSKFPRWVESPLLHNDSAAGNTRIDRYRCAAVVTGRYGSCQSFVDADAQAGLGIAGVRNSTA